MLFSVSYLNDLILIVRTMKQMGLNIADQRRLWRLRPCPTSTRTSGKDAEGLLGVAHWNHDIDADAKSWNGATRSSTGSSSSNMRGGLVAQTFMIADALERAASPDPQKVRDALASLDVSIGLRGDVPRREGEVRPRPARTSTPIRSACSGRTATW